MSEFLRKILGDWRANTVKKRALSSLRGLDTFKSLIGMFVYDLEGQVLGRVNKIIISKRDNRPKQVFVKFKYGTAKISPENLLLVKNKLVYIGEEKLTPEEELIVLENEEDVGQLSMNDFIRFLRG